MSYICSDIFSLTHKIFNMQKYIKIKDVPSQGHLLIPCGSGAQILKITPDAASPYTVTKVRYMLFDDAEEVMTITNTSTTVLGDYVAYVNNLMDALYDTANQLPYTMPMLNVATNQFGLGITDVQLSGT